jgi:hypothetical protein
MKTKVNEMEVKWMKMINKEKIGNGIEKNPKEKR